MNLLLKIIDRVMFYSFYSFYYKKTFKNYGKNIRWGRDFNKLVIPKSVRISCPHKISLGNDCRFDEGVYLQCHLNGGGIEIGNKTRLNAHTHIQSYSKITLEESVLCAPFSHINSGKHGFDNANKAIMDQEYLESGEILLGSGVWLGRGAQVMGGVQVARNSVVAAGAVVTKTFLERSVLAGIPAKKIKEIN